MGLCEYSNEPSGFAKDGLFLDCENYCWRLKEDFVT